MAFIRQPSYLKWAGSKFNALPQLAPLFGDISNNRLVEPFAGSGTVGLNIKAKSYWLNDLNKDLTASHEFLCRDVEWFIRKAKLLFTSATNNADFYYKLRVHFNQSDYQRFRSIAFLYLNRHAFNGICRFNSSGGFNVPFGKYASPLFPEKDIRIFAHHFKDATFTSLNYLEVLDACIPGDVVYCDPPYVPLSASASFTSYTQEGFSFTDQQNLAAKAAELQSKGITVLISNHFTPVTKILYSSATETHTFPVSRTISSKVGHRAKVEEIVAIWKP